MELPHIGQNCQVCNRNDYLPFKCSHCDKIVCVDHKTNHGSDCPMNSSNHEQFPGSDRKPLESLKKACDYCKKITLKLELTHCEYCQNNHCLYHRHQVQHDCRQLILDREARNKEDLERSKRQAEALNRLKDINKPSQGTTASEVNEPIEANQTKKSNIPTAPTRPIDPKKAALAKRIRIMKIKQSARGPPNILDQDKIYFEVRFQHEPNSTLSNASKDGKTIRVHSSGKHPVGRMIDWSASEMDLTNKNHVDKADQLIFKIERKDQLGSMIVQSSNTSDEKDQKRQDNLIILDSHRTFEQYLNSKQLDDGDVLLLTYSVTTI